MSNTVLTSLVALATGVYAYENFIKPKVQENFGNLPPRTIKAQRVQVNPATNAMFAVPGNYQASIAPRFSNVDYGAHIRYNMPNESHLAMNTQNPVSYKNMVFKEGFCGGCGSVEGYCSSGCAAAGCRKGGAGGVASMAQSQKEYIETTDLLPVQDMQGMAVNALGEATQPIIFDRFMYANQKSRLAAQGDPIRGDLPIVPHQNDWFRPSVHPQIDLRDGAILAVAGPDNSTQQELLALQSAATAGLLNVGGGANYTVQKSSFASAAGGDIQVTAFP